MNNTITDFETEAVVIDGGTFPSNPVPLSFLKDCGRVVCCDGAFEESLKRGVDVWRIVGDCDSLSPALRERFREIVRRFPDQETNDQTKAVRYLSSKGIRRIAILGATGRREDHTLGNISLLISYLKEGIEARIYTDYGVFIPVNGMIDVECLPRTQVSIFNFGAVGMSADGLAYPIRDFLTWWEGTLNESPTGKFRIHADGYYLIFLTYFPKTTRPESKPNKNS